VDNYWVAKRGFYRYEQLLCIGILSDTRYEYLLISKKSMAAKGFLKT